MVDKKEEARHKVWIEDRTHMVITGVKKVKSFDTKEILLDTVKGAMTIKGQDLGVKNLDLEQSEVEIEGNIDILNYSSAKSNESSRGVWEKIFK